MRPAMSIPSSLAGWWYTYPPEKYEFVSWDDEIPNIWKIQSHVESHKIPWFQTTNQIQPSDVANSSRASVSPLRMSRVSPLRPAVAVAPVAQGRAYVGQQRAGAHALRARQAVTGVDVVQTQVGVLSEMGNPLVSGISLLMDCPWLMVPGRINGIGYGLTDGVNRRVNGLMGLVMVIN